MVLRFLICIACKIMFFAYCLLFNTYQKLYHQYFTLKF